MVKVNSNLAEITPEVLEAETSETDLNFSGRQSNKELGNFRLLGKSKHQQYFTPVELCQTIFEMISPLIADEKELSSLSVLDPTCGSGRLLLPWKKAGAQVMGIELDKDVALVAKRMLGKDNVRVGDILDYAPHLRDFSLAVSNPPYGIYWNVSQQNIGFECASYGDSIESQSATIEIITQALKYAGILAAIIPSTTFSNAKDSKLREHLFKHYNLLLRATLNNMFKSEYGITGAVDMVIGQKNIDGTKGQAEKLELDVLKDWNWQAKLCQTMAHIIQEGEISFYPSPANYVPVLNNLCSLPVSNQVAITPRGVGGDISSLALLDFTNEIISDYNPIQGIQTGIIDAHLGPASLLKRGLEEAEEILIYLGFEVSIKPADRKKIEQLKQRYDFLSTPLYHPKPHQLLAYFY
ncbi:MAG: N-6 DNA methylase, partial [Elusimicrobia bacterium]|nr:N-6 DNA methylase [Elusimicrobiota bacterium]